MKRVAVAVLLLALLGVTSSMCEDGVQRGLIDVDHARVQMGQFTKTITHYLEEHGSLPSSLRALTEPDPRTGEAYIERIPEDPWGNPYEYRILSGTQHRLLSRGEDGREGTCDDVVWPSEK